MQIKFDRHDRKAPVYLDTLRAKGSSRQFKLCWKAATEGRSHIKKGSVLTHYENMSTALRELFNLDSPNRMPNLKGKTFLDAGCGNSPDALIAALLGASQAHKVDLFPPTRSTNFDHMKEYGWGGIKFEEEEKRNGVNFIKGDICKRLRLDDESIDVISCSAVLDLMSEDDRVVFHKNAYRLLKPGGYLSVYIVYLANGYGNNLNEIEKAKGVGFTELRRYPYNQPTGFVLHKPQAEKAS
jgi:SAM-dependent methyltransferase